MADDAPAPARKGFHTILSGQLRRLYDWVIHWAATPYGLVALFLLAVAESSFFPIPPDVLLLAMCVAAPRKSFKYAAVCTAGSVAGGMIGYGIGALAWHGLEPLFFQYIPGFNAEKFARVQELYNEHGILIVFTAGFSPIPYKLFTITSGVMDQPIGPFLGASLISRGARFFIVGGLIFKLGPRVQIFIDKYFNQLALAFTVLLVGGVLILKWAL